MNERPRALIELGAELDRVARQRLDAARPAPHRSLAQALAFGLAASVAIVVVIGAALFIHGPHEHGMSPQPAGVAQHQSPQTPADTTPDAQQPMLTPADRARLLHRVERLHVQADPVLLRDFAVFGVTSRRGVTVTGLTISHPTIASLPNTILSELASGSGLDPREVRQVTTRSGTSLWVVPGPDTLCVWTLGGGSCAASASGALKSGVVLESSHDGVNWHYAAFPDSYSTATVSTGPHTRTSFPLIDGIFIRRDVAGPHERTYPQPTPPTALSRAAQKNPATPNPVTASPTVGGPHTTFTISFRVLLTKALYRYVVSGPGGRDCTSQIHYGLGALTGGPHDVRGQILSEPYSPGTNNAPAEMKAWCPGTYRVGVAALVPGDRTEFSPPFGSATFTIR